MNDISELGGTEMFVARQASNASFALGAVLSVLGIFAVLAGLVHPFYRRVSVLFGESKVIASGVTGCSPSRIYRPGDCW